MAAVIVPTMKPLVKALMKITAFTPYSLFANGTDGYWGDSGDLPTLYQEDSGTTPVATDGDPVGLRQDKSGNGNHQYQATAASRGTYETDGTYHWIALDGTDDSYLIDVPVGGWAGTYVQGTMQGVIVAEFAVPEGPYQIPTNPDYANAGTDTQLVLVNRVLAGHELDGLVEWVGQRCAVVDFADYSDLQRYFFRDRQDLTVLDTTRWAPAAGNSLSFFIADSTIREAYTGALIGPNVTNLFGFARGCADLVILDLSGSDSSAVTLWQDFIYQSPSIVTLDMSDLLTQAATSFRSFAFGASSLTTVEVYGGTGSPFADSPCTEYTNAFASTNLSQQSYTDIVTAIESAGTSNGTLDITGGSATTTGAAQTAVDALRARGWTVTTPDGY